LGAVEEATAEAAKHGERISEPLAALVAEAKGMIEQAKAEQAERARAAAAEAAAAAVKAAERQQMEQEVAALALMMQIHRTARISSSATFEEHPRARGGECVGRGSAGFGFQHHKPSWIYTPSKRTH
jgi:hypothetical protein